MKTTIHKKHLPGLFSAIFISGISSLCFSQIEDTRGTFKFFRAVPSIQKCNVDGEISGNDTYSINSNILFEIVNECPGNEDRAAGYVIHIYEMKQEEKDESGKKALTQESLTFNTKYSEDNGNEIYFFLTFEEYKIRAYKLRNLASFTVGTAASVIKVRPGIKSTFNDQYPAYFDFGNDFSLGILAGIKIFHSRNPEKSTASNFLFGFGSSAVAIDSVKTRGIVNGSSNSSAIYASFGYVFEYRSFQIGAYMGVDYIAGEVGRNWIYRDRPWFGISMGYSIFKTEAPNQLSDNDKKIKG